ncbi:hypothetical protein OG730_00830 [Streptomyces sp. NBC_01298]|uniref:hypothetical protein n=1 Tax=Streptomyces sp. NBC_01298 TaxID=2903817 RepID=UPI002E0ED0EA|nr:hypothetical protein OG730_00830 [Streptomyces sp. NBC_01298]
MGLEFTVDPDKVVDAVGGSGYAVGDHLNGPDVPYLVRVATPAEGADLVAEWRILEPAWRTLFATTQLDRTRDAVLGAGWTWRGVAFGKL